MKYEILAAVLLCVAIPAGAQTAKPPAKDAAVDRARQRCEQNHGVDCETREGLKEWVNEERPMTAEQQRSAAAARLQRENCAKSKAGAGC